MEREVVVVGAGPSGAAAAAGLAKLGHDVLLLDRQPFPRDKACGDGVPASAIELLYDLGMQEKILAAGFYPCYSLLLSSPRGHVLEADLKPGPQGAHSYIVPRLHFDALVQRHAIDAGADYCHGQVKEPIIEDGQVVGVRARLNGRLEDVRSQLVIGADGVTSVVTRALRPDKPLDGHRAVALRAYVEGLEERANQVEFYLYKGILPGYAWIFPLGEGRANVGLGMRLDKFRQAGRSLEELLDVFLDLPAIKARLRPGWSLNDMATWQLNFGSQDMRRAYAGALLVGDAAGLINPLTGGGISNGLRSAYLAAEVGHAALAADDLTYARLRAYEHQVDAEMQQGMRRSYLIQRSLIWLPFASDLIIRWGGANSELARTFVSKL
ncbi:MAG: NAD(P)/FAD-dependent oxidoreductase [Candidatus Promineifilaceae bacterium]